MTTPTLSVDWERTISTSGATRATAYMASNKIVSNGDIVFVTWLDTPGRAMIRAFASDGTPQGDAVLLNEGIDNHCGAALCVEQNGYLHAVCGSHSEVPFSHRVSREPWSWDNWWPARPISDSPTYPSVACDTDNRLHLTYRWWHGISAQDEPKAYHVAPTAGYQRSRKDMTWEKFGHRRDVAPFWTDPVSLVVPLVPNQYCQFGSSLAPDKLGRIHFGFHVYDQKYRDRGHTLGYLRSDDGGDTWRTAAGEEVVLPCGPTTADTLESDFTIPETSGDGLLDMRSSNVAVTPEGNPLIAAFHRENGDAVLWEHDGESWHSISLLSVLNERGVLSEHSVVSDSSTRRYFSMDGSLSVDRDGNTYLAAQTVQDPLHWGTPDAEVVVLFRPAMQRDHWQVLPISEPDDSPSWQPSLERVTSVFQTMGTPYLAYQHGTKGVGCETYDLTEVRFVAMKLL
jgi:hypothetical protein